MRVKKLTYEELTGLSQQLALIVDSDISVQEGITLILEQTTTKHLKSMLERMKEGIQNGKTLGQVIESEDSMIPEYYIDMIRIGEESGNIHTVLLSMAESYEKDIKTAKKVRSAITYPVVLTVLMLGVIVLLITTVMPMFKDILSSLGGEIPAFTNLLINISSAISGNIFVILGFLIVILLAIDLYINTKNGKRTLDRLKLRVPIQRMHLKIMWV